jgi:DNA invertase Pin-like site-specific DNA recombinase
MRESRQGGLRCATYARVSSDLQDVENSITRQVEACRKWAERNGHTIAKDHTYQDEAKSGSSSLARPAFQELWSVLRSHAPLPFDAILVDDTSRLDRSGELREIARTLEALQVKLIDVSSGTDLTEEERRSTCHLKAAISEQYLLDLSRRTRGGLIAKVRQGLHAGGRIYGYDLVPTSSGTTIRINEEQARIVRRVFEEYAGGVGLRPIAHKLNAEGIPSPRGGTWDHTAIRSMLLNPKYRGDFYWNKSRWQKKPEALLTDEEKHLARQRGRHPRMRVLKPAEELVGEHREELRIVPEEVWQAVQGRFEARKREGRLPSRRPRHLVSGLVRCACGGNIVVLRSHRKEARLTDLGCPRHRNRGKTACDNTGLVREPDLASAILQPVRTELLQPEALDWAVGEAERKLRKRAARSDSGKRLRALRTDLTKVETEIKRYVDAIGEGLDVSEVKDALLACRTRRQEIQDEIHALEQPRETTSLPRLSRQDLVKATDRLWDLLNAGDVARARWLLQRLLGEGRLKVVGPNEKRAWKIGFQARPLEILLPSVRFSYNGGSGGGISSIDKGRVTRLEVSASRTNRVA